MNQLKMKTVVYEFNVGVKKPVSLFVFSDLHITEDLPMEVLTALYRRAKRSAPDAIIFLGDMVDTVEFLDKKNNYKLLKNFLNELAEIAPLYIIVGNHDMRSIPGRKRRMLVKEPEDFWRDITKNHKIKILRNEAIETEKYFVAGVEQGPSCYNLDKDASASTLQKHILVSEKAEMMEVALKKFLRKIKTPKKATEKPKILLVHSARFLTERNLGGLVKDYDVILSGHLHNMAMSEKVFRKMMSVWGLGLKNGHLVCPPVTAFTDPKKQRHYTRYCAIVKIK